MQRLACCFVFQDLTDIFKSKSRTNVRNKRRWLRVPDRVTYKLCTMVYKSLYGLDPGYLADSCIPVARDSSGRNLRSADKNELLVPRQTFTIPATIIQHCRSISMELFPITVLKNYYSNLLNRPPALLQKNLLREQEKLYLIHQSIATHQLRMKLQEPLAN